MQLFQKLLTEKCIYAKYDYLAINEKKGKERKEKEERPVNIYTFQILQGRMWLQYTWSSVLVTGDKYTLWNLILF